MDAPYHLRRRDRQITDPTEIDSILTRGRFVTLGLVDGDEPYVVTLSYGLDAAAERLYFHVAHEGHKMDVIASNPRACGTVIVEDGYTHGECEHPFESVIIRGALRVVTDEAEKLHAIHTLVEHLEDDPGAYWESRTWSLQDRMGGFTALALEVEHITGKRGR